MPKLFKIVLVLYCVVLSLCVQGQNSNSTDSRNIFSEALQAFEQKQYPLAQNLFETFLSTNSANVEKNIQAQYYICLTSLYLQQPDFGDKLKRFRDKYPTHPKTIAITYQVGSFYFDKKLQKDYRTASRHLRKIAVDNPKTKQEFSMNYKLAYAYGITQRFNDAIPYFKTVIKTNHLNVHSQDANYYLGLIYLYDKTNYVEAAKCFHHVLSNDRLGKSAYNLLATSYFLAGNYKNGKKYWDKIETKKMTISPELAKVAGKQAFKMEKYTDAVTFLKNVEVDLETQMILANSWLHLGEDEEAINGFLDLLNLPESEMYKQQINQNLGMAYLKMNDYDKASQRFKIASQLFEDETVRHKAALYWARSAFQAKDYLEATHAAQYYQTNYGRAGTHSENMNIILAYSHQNLGNIAEALEYNKKLKNPPKGMQLDYQRLTHRHAEEFYTKKEYQKAIEAFEASLKYKHRDETLVSRAYFIMGNIAFEREMYAQAESHYNKIAKTSPFLTEALYYKGYIARNRGNHNDALTYFLNYVSKNNRGRKEIHHLDALVRLADTYAILRKYSLANGTYEQALRKGYRKPDYVFYNKGKVLLIQKKKEQALRQFDHIIYKYPESAHVYEALYSKSLILKDRGERKNALAVMSTLLGKNPPFETKIRAYFQRASLHSGLSMEQLAIQDYESVLKLSSTDSLSQKSIHALNKYQNLGYKVENLATMNARFEQLNPESKTLDQIRFEKAEAFAKSNNDIPELKEQLKPFLEDKNSPYYDQANYLMGGACEMRQDKSGMLEYYSKIKGQLREKVLLKLGEIQLDRKNFSSAAGYYAEARHFFKNESQKSAAFKGLIQAYEGLEEWDGLEQAVKKLDRLNIPNAQAFVRLYKGKILVRNKQYTEAIAELDKAQFDKKNDENAKIILLLGETLNLNGDYHKSNTLLSSFKKNYRDYQNALKRAKEIMDNNFQSLNKK